MQAVKEQKNKIKIESTKSYMVPNGQNGIISLFKYDPSSNHVVIKDQRIATIQTPGGCGALKIGAELIKKVEKLKGVGKFAI